MSEMGDLKFTTAGDYMMSEAKIPEGRKTLEEFYRSKKYVVVTTISSHRMRYVMNVEDLQDLNPCMNIAGHEEEWASDTVTCQEVEEFSQDWLGEQIIDTSIVDEEEMLKLFDKDNDYLNGWDRDYKVQWVRKNLKKGST
jgi:hypothetical protein